MYTEIPRNYSEIKNYVSEDVAGIATALGKQQKLFFYDTCAFRKHAALPHPEPLITYFLNTSGVVVITRGILMELASTGHALHSNCISYIQKLHVSGVPIVVLYEEDIFVLLEQCFSSALQINNFLFWAVASAKYTTGTVEKALNSNPLLYQNLLVTPSSDRTLFRLFFNTVRQNKEPDDNLGEELLAVCAHLLANLPFLREYQFIILTEDKGALFIIEKAAQNSYNQLRQHRFATITTPRLVQHLYATKIISGEEQVKELLSANLQNDSIGIYGSGPYNLTPGKMTLSASELAQKIVTPDAIHINY